MSNDTPAGSTTRQLTPNRRRYLQATGGVVALGTAGLAGCLDDDSPGATGFLSTAVTDQPGDIADFDSCVVTIDGIWLSPRTDDAEDAEDADDENGDDADDADDEDDGVQAQDEDDVDQGDGRTYYAFDEPQEADLVELQDGETQLIDEDRDVPVGEYRFLQLDIASVSGILADSGDEADVETPGNAPLQFTLRFEIRENQRTTFTGDFTPVRRGQTDRYLLQPVARNTAVSYEDVDDADDENGADDGDNENGADDGDDENGADNADDD